MSQIEHPPSIDERSNHCFGCSQTNPQGLHLVFDLQTAGEITATTQVTLTHLHEGASGYIHGGIIATLLDEAMSKLSRPLHLLAMTRSLQVDYLRPCPVETTLTLTARHIRREGRKLFQTASLTHPDGTILATATGLFIAVDPALVSQI